MKSLVRFLKPLTLFLSVAFLFLTFPVSSNASQEWNHYLGQLHSHSGYLDDLSVPGYAPADAFAQAKEAGMDFFGLTDFSHSLEDTAWNQGKTAAREASGGNFTALYGYEAMDPRNPRQNHGAVFGTSGYLCWEPEGFLQVTDFLDALVTDPGSVGMFCHPDPVHGDFDYLEGCRWDYDNHMALFEVMGQNGETFFDAYHTALVKGWHVAPAANSGTHKGDWAGSPVRTGVLAEGNGEEALLDALKSRRVYATADPGLQITYRLGGHILGSRLTALDHYNVHLQISQPEGLTVRVVTEEGPLEESLPASAQMEFSVAPGHRFYYIQLEKAGQILAVTAPVWVEPPTNFGVSELTASTAVPVQGEAVHFSFTLYNREPVDMVIDRIRLLADGQAVWESSRPEQVASWQSLPLSIPYTHQGAGVTRFTLDISGTIGANPVSVQKELSLSYRPKILNAHILVDGRHSNVTLDQLKNLTALASEADMDVALFRNETPEGAKVMVLPPLESDFSEGYPQLLKDFVEAGGILILCGREEDNRRANALLEALGSTMQLCNDTARDPVNNGGVPESLYVDTFHTGADCWKNLTGDEVYSHQFGSTVNPGSGTWLVKGRDSMGAPVLLAQETLGKGMVIAAGSFFLDDEHLLLPRNPWDIPSANQRLLEALLEIQRIQLPVTEIQAVRSGTLGEIYRVKGYVTAGTAKEHNRFPEMIYLQDGSGGIEITAFSMPDIQVGYSLDITGQLHMDGQNPALKLISCRHFENDLYRHDPAAADHKTAMDYANHGGELMKIEGTAENIEYTAEGLGVRRFTLRDEHGDPAAVLVEDYILSGAEGVNHLAQQVMEGQRVRAYGIVHLEAGGTPVLRVRNCDEVVYIPPIPEKPEKEEPVPDLSNPNTGDPFARFFTFLHN